MQNGDTHQTGLSQTKGLVKQHLHHAERLFKKKQYPEALAKVTEVIASGEASAATARAYHLRAKINREAGNLDAAIADIAQAVARNPAQIELHRTQAECFAAAGRVDEAVRAYLSIAEMAASKAAGADHDALYHIARIYYEQKDYSRAVEYFTASIAAGGTLPLVYGSRALAYVKLGSQREAEQDRTEAALPEWYTEINPRFFNDVSATLQGPHPEHVSYRPPEAIGGLALRQYQKAGKAPSGLVIFGPPFMQRAYDAETGELVWRS
jgi:tetratricopeptide (TPR) repeat protein